MNAIPSIPHAKSSTQADAHIGAKVREARMFRQLSQMDLGDRLGLSFQQVQKYEKGENRVAAGRLFEIARILGVAPAWFYEGLETVHEGERPPLLDAFQRRLLETLDRVSDDRTRQAIIKFLEAVADGLTLAAVRP